MSTLTALLGTNAWALFVGRGGYSDENLVQFSLDFIGRSPIERAPHREKIDAMERAVKRLVTLPIVEAAGYADSLPDERAGCSVRRGRDQRRRSDPVVLGRIRRTRSQRRRAALLASGLGLTQIQPSLFATGS